MSNRIQIRRGNTTDWETTNIILSSGELGFDFEKNVLKIGDGLSPWNNLDPFGAGATVNVSPEAPPNPKPAELWWNSTTGILYIYYVDETSGQWVDATYGTGLAAYTASDLSYDNEVSGLVAEDVQEAIDEVVVNLGNKLVEADLVDLNSDLIPSTTETYDLGSETNKWKDLYLSGDTIFLGSIKLQDDEGKLAIVDSENNALALDEFEPTIEPTTAVDYYRGDKTFQPLNAAAVGLENVTNESKTTMFTDAALTGVPTAPTAAAATNTTQIATTAFVSSEINAVVLGLNRSFVVEDLQERDALEGLNVGDFVFVADNNDEKWAQYKLINDDPKEFVKIMDQDIMLNALNAPDIKAAYESNADTNAFTDAEQTRLAGLELGVTVQPYDANTVIDANYETFDPEGTYPSLRAQATTKEDVGLSNVDNESKATMFTDPTFTGQVAFTPTTLGTTGTINIDFAGSTSRTQAALTGNITYTGSNYANGRSVMIRVINGGTQRTLSFPGQWRFIGPKPANIAANKVAVLSLSSFGTAESDVIAGWAVEE